MFFIPLSIVASAVAENNPRFLSNKNIDIGDCIAIFLLENRVTTLQGTTLQGNFEYKGNDTYEQIGKEKKATLQFKRSTFTLSNVSINKTDDVVQGKKIEATKVDATCKIRAKELVPPENDETSFHDLDWKCQYKKNGKSPKTQVFKFRSKRTICAAKAAEEIWTEHETEEGETYYHNQKTNESVWEKPKNQEQDSWEELKVKKVFEHVPGLVLKKGEAKIYLGEPFSSGTYGQISIAYLEKQPGTIIEIGVAKEFYKGPYLEPELDPENIKVRNEIFAAKVLAIIKTVSNHPSQKDFHDKILLMEAYDSDLQIRDNECVKLPLNNANMLWMQLSKSLSHLHSLGYTHNDIKPGNILRSADNEKFVFTDFGLMTPRTDAGVVTDILNLLRVFWCVLSQDVNSFDKQLFPDDKFVDRIKVWDFNEWGKPIMFASNKWRDWLDLYCTSESPRELNLVEQCNMITLKLGKFLGEVQKVYDPQGDGDCISIYVLVNRTTNWKGNFKKNGNTYEQIGTEKNSSKATLQFERSTFTLSNVSINHTEEVVQGINTDTKVNATCKIEVKELVPPENEETSFHDLDWECEYKKNEKSPKTQVVKFRSKRTMCESNDESGVEIGSITFDDALTSIKGSRIGQEKMKSPK